MSPSLDRDSTALPRHRWPWTTPLIGVHLGRPRAIALERRGSELAWMLEGPGLEEFDGAEEAMTALLMRLPRARGTTRAPRVIVALARECVQCKPLFAFPPVRDRLTGSALVREGATRFFRRTADDLITSAVEHHDDRGAMAAAFEAPMVRGIRQACARAGVRLHAIVPTETLPAGAECPPSVSEEWQRAAWNATSVLSQRGPIAFNALTGHGTPDDDSPAHLRAAIVSAAIAILLLLAAPPASARIIAARAARAHATLRAREASAIVTSLELVKVSEAISEISAHAASRRSVLGLLADISATLPPGAAITQLQLDSVAGTLAVLAPSADGLVKELSASPLLGAPAVVGPVTRERAGAGEVDRLIVRFRHTARQASEERKRR